jgi:hypothetical protein
MIGFYRDLFIFFLKKTTLGLEGMVSNTLSIKTRSARRKEGSSSTLPVVSSHSLTDIGAA